MNTFVPCPSASSPLPCSGSYACSGRGPRADHRSVAAAARRVGVVERLGEKVALERSFVDEGGRTTTLGAFAGKPLLLTFNYTRCATSAACSCRASPRRSGAEGAAAGRGLRGRDAAHNDPSETTPRAPARPRHLRGPGGRQRRPHRRLALPHRHRRGRCGRRRASVGVSYRYDEDAKEYTPPGDAHRADPRRAGCPATCTASAMSPTS